jgi:hypothetical protein
MATPTFVQVAPTGNGNTNTIYAATLTGGSASAVIPTGNNMIIRIACVNPVSVRFGTTGNLTTATAGDILVIGPHEFFDMGYNNNAICIYANSTTLVSVNVVSKN